MAPNGQSVQTMNKRKVRLLKKKRLEVKNHKKVKAITYGKNSVLRKPRASKKKQQKNAQRHRFIIDAEKEKLLKSGLLSKQDIDELNQKINEDNNNLEQMDIDQE